MKNWFLKLMSALQRRPEMLLGDGRIETLRAYVSGYRRAYDHLGVSFDDNELQQFGQWLGTRYETDPDWYGACRRVTAKQPASAVHKVVDLYGEFASETGTGLLEPANAMHAWLPEPPPADKYGVNLTRERKVARGYKGVPEFHPPEQPAYNT